MIGKQPLARPLVVEPAEEEFNLAAGDPQAQVVTRNGLQRVGLIEDRDVVLGQEAGARASQGQVAHEQGVVDDQDVGRPHSLASLEVEAVAELGAFLAQAVAVLGGHGVPDGRGGPEVEVGPAPVLGPVRPELDLGELVEVLDLLESRPGTRRGGVKPPEADVVRPPFHQDGRELVRHDRPEERDVFLQELFLEADRVGRDDDLLAGLGRREDRRDEVGEALAHACPGLDHQVRLVLDRPRHGAGHHHLLGAFLVPVQPPGDRPAGTEDRVRVELRHPALRLGKWGSNPAHRSHHWSGWDPLT